MNGEVGARRQLLPALLKEDLSVFRDQRRRSQLRRVRNYGVKSVATTYGKESRVIVYARDKW